MTAALVPVQPGIPMAQRIPTDLRPTEQPLGTRPLEGVKATGLRTTTIIPTGRVGNDRPIQITDERWESPELNVLIHSRFSDPRTGVVEYRLTNISRAEPSAGLFMVTPDYTIVGPGQPGARGRGARGDGARILPSLPDWRGQREQARRTEYLRRSVNERTRLVIWNQAWLWRALLVRR